VPSAGERPLPSSSIVTDPLASFIGGPKQLHRLYLPFVPPQLVFPSLASYKVDEQKDLEQSATKLAHSQLSQLFQPLQPELVLLPQPFLSLPVLFLSSPPLLFPLRPLF